MEKHELTQLTKKYSLEIKEATIAFNESGLDFLVAFAEDVDGNEWVFRLPRRDDVFDRTVIEKKVLDLIHNQVSFQIPHWTIYEKDLIAYKKLSGVPAGTIDPEIQNYVWEMDHENVPEQYHQSLGEKLASLHQFSKDDAKKAGVPIQDAAEARESMMTRMEKVKQTFGVGESLWNRWQTWVQNDQLWPMETGLIHGDVHAGHIMIDKHANVTGLIDWTEAKVTDISSDFVFQYSAFGEAALEKLIHYYKEAGGIYWPKMKEHIIELHAAYAIAVAEFAMISGKKEYEDMARSMLELG